MVILGLDPGSVIAGFGAIETEGQITRPADFGCIRTDAKLPFAQRLQKIYRELTEVFARIAPDEVAVEEVFFSKNVQSALKIGHARGVMLLAAADAGLPISEYSPREVKQAVVGSGSASKEQVQFMVKHLLSLKDVPKPYDTTDALAVALCHAHRIKMDAMMRKDG
ncbi:MAG: crossover junction endodeoxyribonuclease RuvC [Candidatus Latescibacterota bacterium]